MLLEAPVNKQVRISGRRQSWLGCHYEQRTERQAKAQADMQGAVYQAVAKQSCI